MSTPSWPSPTDFPTVRWKNETATFVAENRDSSVPDPARAPAALVFPFYGDRVVLADIETRGWCIPSGHVEPGETFEDAVRREAFEEAGATLGRVAAIGYFVLTHTETHTVRFAPTFIGEVRGLGAVPAGSESRGAQLVNVEDVAQLYFSWDDLLAAVFNYAYQQKEARLPVGMTLNAFMSDDDSGR